MIPDKKNINTIIADVQKTKFTGLQKQFDLVFKELKHTSVFDPNYDRLIRIYVLLSYKIALPEHRSRFIMMN